MSRIRSIHPGFWTDERIVSMTPLARLLFIGIWNECDDFGSFAWNPITLRMRILPGENCEMAALLDELISSGCVMRYELDGRVLGAVRNFTRFQRPKKPNQTYPQTPAVRNWCGTASEKSSQMEEVIGGEEIKGGRARARASPVPDEFEPDLTQSAREVADRIGTKRLKAEVQRFTDHHRAKGSTMVDWQAAFRTWLARCEEYGPGGTGHRNGGSNGAGKGRSFGDFLAGLDGSR